MSDDKLLKEFNEVFDKRDCYDYSCEARDCCECSTYQDALEEFKKERENSSEQKFGKLKVSVAFQNHFATTLYNKAENAIFEWLGKHNIPAAIWRELTGAVNDALYAAIKECMNNNGTLVELFSDVNKSIYIKQYSKGYLKSWTKEQLIEQIECLQHNCAVAFETNYNQAQYFDKCVSDEVQKRLIEIVNKNKESVEWLLKQMEKNATDVHFTNYDEYGKAVSLTVAKTLISELIKETESRITELK